MMVTPAQSAELKYLRRMVDNNQDRAYRKDASPDATNQLYQAQQELKKYVNRLRQEGYKI